jgi:hypothetical protein
MKRRRHTLQVSTFPFLAVLLCAMGSLILLLLVIDRRAKVVMRAKALAAVRQMEADEAKESAAHAAEWEQRRRALHDQLQQQKQELEAQSAALKRQVADAANELKAEQAQGPGLESRLQAEKENTLREENMLAALARDASQKKEQSQAASAELARLSGELVKLEQTLEDLKALRKRQQQTYSLVPYRGHRGDNRQPIYVECAAASIIFHPDRLTIPTSDSSGSAVLQEVERRVNRQPSTNSESTPKDAPYLLLLVRPDGIVTYYRALAALRNLKIDFGYEFVEADWVLDFSQDQKATQSWMVDGPAPSVNGEGQPRESARKTAQPSIERRSLQARGPGGEGLSTNPGGLSAEPGNIGVGGRGAGTDAQGAEQDEDAPPQLKGWRGLADGGELRRLRHFATLPTATPGAGPPTPGGGTITGSGGPGIFAAGPASGTSPGVTLGTAKPRGASFAGTRVSEAGTASDEVGTAGSPGMGSPRGRADSSPGFLASTQSTTTPFSRDPIGERSPSASGSGSATRNADVRPTGDSSLLSGKSAPANGMTPNGSPPTSRTGVQSAPSLIPTFDAPPPEGASRPGQAPAGRVPSSEPEDAGPHLGSSSGLSQLGAEREKKPGPTPVVRRYVRREWDIFVECTADRVIIYPGGSQIPATSLSDRTRAQALLQAIQQMIAHRQALIASSDVFKDAAAYSPQIRFLVRPNGLRTYFFAYPQLESLHLPMSRENLDANEDVIRRIQGR